MSPDLTISTYWTLLRDELWHFGARNCNSDVLVVMSLSKKTKKKDVALSKLKMDCRCRKLSPFVCQFLSAVNELEKDCRYIFEQCYLNLFEGLTDVNFDTHILQTTPLMIPNVGSNVCFCHKVLLQLSQNCKSNKQKQFTRNIRRLARSLAYLL